MAGTDFGTCMSCTDDLRLGRRVSGEEAVLEQVYRIFDTPRGALITDSEWGCSLEDWLSDDVSPARLAALPSQARAALKRDERIRDARVVAQWNATDSELSLDLTLTLSDGTMRLVVLASSGTLTVELLNS